MSSDILLFIVYGVVVVALAWPLGLCMARLFEGGRTILTPVLGPVERLVYRAGGIDPQASQHWTRYAAAALAFNAVGWLILYAVLRLQGFLPLNPEGFAGLSPDLAFNTAVSFVTNTNWQAYGGETTLSYLSQMAGLTVQNFVSAATGIAVGVAVIRGFAGSDTAGPEARGLGNFWVDLTRATLYLLLPLSVLFALFLVWQGVPQNLSSYVEATTLEGARQTIPQGPAAAQIAIKQLGTNGGGFFNANSAVPYENPTPLSNFAEMVAILLVPAAFTFMFGRLVRDMRQGVAIFAAMGILFLAALALTYGAESEGNALFANLPIDQASGNMEGKEVRFGVGESALWATATTAASNGSVNSMHDSFTPLGAFAPMLLIQTGEVVFGGVGSGFYGMLAFVVLTVFLAGLMVGRTPEYLGRKIEAKEVKLAVIAFLVMPFGVLVFGAAAATIPMALASVQDRGPHGLSEILYAYSSATGNNGSAFAGFGAATPFHDTLLGIAMLLGRYAFIVPMLAIAGSLAAKKKLAASAGTFPTDGPLFVTLLVAVVLILGGLTFFPALALGPIAEHTAMLAGETF
ncbi:potassium-transporting ATPase subunit KdpA [Afifella sp. IM 167]|uniref:potassium-transporting ATPase subunit KdpA n=1 Tax=Afifella sp. IM 167 TaxID=2033586 RepID=UPI001CCE9164|nr:potassium-transporting ATPase subunit KdpA [Afifella sp. IM 167]MBZ8134430.1 potassium-transporting ATPase subunit KdpA [Afifella sp. IM 167]